MQLHFPATGETLTYAAASAPLRRVEFEVGDTVTEQGGAAFVVAEVREENGLFTYVGDETELHESGLSDAISFDKPEAKLLAAQSDEPHLCRLRRAALLHRFKCRSREIHGLCGARISLIPHQLYIAHEVVARQAPRVLLADEVGLGKTIEAGLILHRLHLTGRARRILVIVPEALVHQWFVELLRRFQLSFSIFDEERADAIEAGAPGENPFRDDQLILMAADWLAGERDSGGAGGGGGLGSGDCGRGAPPRMEP